jgi:hypothetical protein
MKNWKIDNIIYDLYDSPVQKMKAADTFDKALGHAKNLQNKYPGSVIMIDPRADGGFWVKSLKNC